MMRTFLSRARDTGRDQGSVPTAAATSRTGRARPAACALALAAALAAPAAARAQDPAPDSLRAAELDSLRERLRRAEDAIELLREQLAAQAASGVQTRTRVRADLFGRVLTNAFYNDAAVNNADVPLFVATPTTPSGEERPQGGLGASVRQTSVGVAVSVSHVLGGDFLGDLQADFFGGQQPSTGGRNFPLLRVRKARGIVRWARGELLAGQESPLVADVDPVSVASVGTPGFTAAGNLWLWAPQLRGTLQLGTRARLAVQGAVAAPTTGDPATPFDTDVDAAEQSKRPVLQLRLRSRWGEDDTRGEIGVGAHRGWVRSADGSLVTSEALVVSAEVPLTRVVELRGEVYTGQALRGLGGGGIGQNLTAAGEPVRDRGGWAQLDVRPRSYFQFGAGCGVADPEDEDVPAGRLRNVVCAAHAIARPGGGVLVGLEFRRLRTTYAAGPEENDHLNLAAGFEF